MSSCSKFSSDTKETHKIDKNSKMPHPVMLITLKNTQNQWLVVKILIGECCMGTRNITYNLATALGYHFIEDNKTTPFMTAMGIFQKHVDQAHLLQTPLSFHKLILWSNSQDHAAIKQRPQLWHHSWSSWDNNYFWHINEKCRLTENHTQRYHTGSQHGQHHESSRL